MTDLTKTQFLFEVRRHSTSIRAFKRKRRTFLFDKEGKPLYPMEFEAWDELRKKWPDEVARDGLKFRVVWTLEEIKV